MLASITKAPIKLCHRHRWIKLCSFVVILFICGCLLHTIIRNEALLTVQHSHEVPIAEFHHNDVTAVSGGVPHDKSGDRPELKSSNSSDVTQPQSMTETNQLDRQFRLSIDSISDQIKKMREDILAIRNPKHDQSISAADSSVPETRELDVRTSKVDQKMILQDSGYTKKLTDTVEYQKDYEVNADSNIDPANADVIPPMKHGGNNVINEVYEHADVDSPSKLYLGAKNPNVLDLNLVKLDKTPEEPNDPRDTNSAIADRQSTYVGDDDILRKLDNRKPLQKTPLRNVVAGQSVDMDAVNVRDVEIKNHENIDIPKHESDDTKHEIDDTKHEFDDTFVKSYLEQLNRHNDNDNGNNGEVERVPNRSAGFNIHDHIILHKHFNDEHIAELTRIREETDEIAKILSKRGEIIQDINQSFMGET